MIPNRRSAQGPKGTRDKKGTADFRVPFLSACPLGLHFEQAFAARTQIQTAPSTRSGEFTMPTEDAPKPPDHSKAATG